jgi:putative DNA primase/helicase
LKRERGCYVAAAWTVLRAYIVAGRPITKQPLGGFEGWSKLVRDALLWLGEADPVATIETARTTDPETTATSRVLTAWADEIGCDRAHTAPEIIALAEEKHAYPKTGLKRPETRAALLDVAAARGKADEIDPRRLGRWLVRREGAVAGGVKLAVDRSDERRVRYVLRCGSAAG